MSSEVANGRSTRPRKPVNYDLKSDNWQPTWAKEQNYTENSGSPVEKKKKPAKKNTDSAEKENSGKAKGRSTKPPAKAQKEAKEAEKPIEIKPKKTAKAKETAVPTRGNKANLKTVPIVDHKETAKGGKRSKQQQPVFDSDNEDDVIDLISPPEQPKTIPGLKGVTQKGGASAKKGSGSGSQKRKAAAGPTPASVKQQKTTAARKQQKPLADSSDDEENHVEEQQQKRQPKRPSPVAAPLPPPRAAIVPAARPAARARAAPAIPVHIDDYTPMEFEPLPSLEAQERYEKLSKINRDLSDKLHELLKENRELKETQVSGQVERMLEAQNAHVAEHGQAAADLGNIWKKEVERLQAMIEEEGTLEARNKLIKLQNDLNTVQLAVLDLESMRTDDAKIIAELKKRNQFLERYARPYDKTDKCVGTTGPYTASANVQVPDNTGIQMYQARAMAPEGAEGSWMYHHDEPADKRALNATYAIEAQRTYRAPATRAGLNGSGSDMQIASSGGNKNQQGEFAFPQMYQNNAMAGGRRASVSHVTGSDAHFGGPRSSGNNRRLTAPPQMLAEAAAARQHRSIAAGPGLSAVPEDGNEEDQAGPTYTSSGPYAPRELALPTLTGLAATPIKGNRYLYVHRGSGYQFELGPAPQGQGEEDEGFDMEYLPIEFGIAQEALATVPLGSELINPEGFYFKADQAERLMQSIMLALSYLE